MVDYTVRFLENGKNVENLAAVRLPGDFTAEDIIAYIKKVDLEKTNLRLYIKNNLFIKNLDYMVSNSQCNQEEIIEINYSVFTDDIRPDYVLNFEDKVSAFKFSQDYVFVATLGKRLFAYDAKKSFGETFSKGISETVIQIDCYMSFVLGLSTKNQIVNLHTDEVVLDGMDNTITCFCCGNNIVVVGFYNGQVKLSDDTALSLKSKVIFVCHGDKNSEGNFFVASSELGEVSKYDLDTQKTASIDLNAILMSGHYYQGKLYLAADENIFILSDNLEILKNIRMLFHFVDWLSVNTEFVFLSNYKELLILRKGEGILTGAIYQKDQIVSIDRNDVFVLLGANNSVEIFSIDKL